MAKTTKPALPRPDELKLGQVLMRVHSYTPHVDNFYVTLQGASPAQESCYVAEMLMPILLGYSSEPADLVNRTFLLQKAPKP